VNIPAVALKGVNNVAAGVVAGLAAAAKFLESPYSS